MEYNPYQNDLGVYYTNAMFLELNTVEPEVAIYTLGPKDITKDGKTYISIRKRYLEANDPTEYKIAEKYFASWQHWKKVCESSKIKPLIEEWREELEVKMRSQGLTGVLDKALEGDYQASKWFAEKGWVPTGDRKRGAPSKEEKARELRIASKVGSVIDLDYQRLMKK